MVARAFVSRAGRAFPQIVLASWSLCFLIGGSGPEIIRASVPAREVGRWFPGGTEVRVMPPQAFESMARRALQRSSETRLNASPRLLRARHSARWAAGVLSGKSEFVFEPRVAGPGDFVLEPWTPAVLPTAEARKVLGARDSGQPSLFIDQAKSEPIVLEWELQARSYAKGRGMVLRLPGNETTVLSLELPRGLVPAIRLGTRRGPLPASDSSGSRWEIDAEAGQFELHLYEPLEHDQSTVESHPWLSSTTEIDLRAHPGGAGGFANWVTVWSVELDRRNPAPLEVELEKGLELIDLQGNAVRGFHTRPSQTGVHVQIALEGEFKSPTLLRFVGHADVPAEGAWSIPAMRPASAVWTEGKTTVILDELHVLQECREKSGRRVLPLTADPGLANRLVFESASPESVAELVFHKPRALTSCEVRGQVFIGRSPGWLECRLKWLFPNRPVSELEIDLSPAWMPERVSIRGLDDPFAWHSSALPSGDTRLRVALPPAALAQRELTLVVRANSAVPGGRGALALPRVRPVGVRIAEEAWLAWVDPDTMIRPTTARGLAWIDPREVPGLSVPPSTGAELREALAWRWTRDQASARVDCERIEQEPTATIRTLARLDNSCCHLSLDGKLLLSCGTAPLDLVPIWISQAGDSLKSWHFQDAADGTELPVRPLEEAARARLGFPGDGFAGSLPVKVPGQAEKTILFHAEFAWKGRGSIPLLAVSRKYLFRGTIQLETPAETQSRVETAGLRSLDPSALENSDEDNDPDTDEGGRGDLAPAKDAVVRALAYTQPGGHLELFAEPLLAARPSLIIRSAVLTTRINRPGRSLHRLRLLIGLGSASALDLNMPPELSLVRVRRDGVDINPIRSGSGLSVPLHGLKQGARSNTVVLDYESREPERADSSRLRPPLPEVDAPCLAFLWEVVTPAQWVVAALGGGGLVAHDRDDQAVWPFGALGLSRSWSALFWRPDQGAGAELFRQLDKRLLEPPSDELTFAELFSRWDAGACPVVVDRVSLDSAGLGPKSPCVPGRMTAAGEVGVVSRTTLQRYGLSAVLLGKALVITTLGEVPEPRTRDLWTRAIGEALAWGSDRSDRFQTVARWRGEPAPRVAGTAGDGTADRVKLLPGWSTWRFTGQGWPARDDPVYLVDVSARAKKGWLLAGLFVLAMLMCRRLLARARSLILVAILVLCLVLEALQPAQYASFTAAGFLGVLVVFFLELGHTLRRARATGAAPGRRRESSLHRSLGAATASAALLAILLGKLVCGQGAASYDRSSAILALFPYDGSFDPARPADRVILRLEDFNRLAGLAAAPAPTPTGSVRAVSAVHQVTLHSAKDIVVESEFELVAAGQAPFSWEMPVASMRDIAVTLDGKSQPILIERGGTKGTVAIPRAGKFLLRMRRRASTSVQEGFQVLSLPISALPSARAIIAPPHDGVPQGELCALGRTNLEPDQTRAGLLGPADRLEVRWKNPDGAVNTHRGSDVEALFLWDINPGGDRVRARFTFLQHANPSSVRLAHESGLLLRSAQVSGSAVTFCEENAARDEWILQLDPPLQAGSTVSLDCWMPLDTARRRDGKLRTASGKAEASIRRLPRLRPVDCDRYKGSLGARRPGEWTGRLASFPVADVLGDEAFVRAWGALPAEPLTFCGTTRFVGDASAALRTGPPPSRSQVKPTVELQIESGRIVMTVEAEVAELSGHLQQIEANLPEDIQHVQVVADGLADWSLSARGRLSLLFEPAVTRPRRHLRITGWIPLSEDPLPFGSRWHRAPTPWISGEGIEGTAGVLSISSTSRPEMVGATGLALISSESSAGTGTTPPKFKTTYRVEEPRKLGEIVWESSPARVSVALESQVRVYPDSAEWAAVLRYDTIGGALDAIHLRIPSAWATNAELVLSGSEDQLTTETRGPMTFWTITPEHPIWGSRRFALRSTVVLPPGRELIFPEIAPLGFGEVDAYLGVVNASGRPLDTENVAGLQEIPFETRFLAKEFAGGVGTPLAAFRVMREPWSLSVQPARSPSDANHSPDGLARVDLADVVVTLRPDRSSVGRALYHTVPDSGRSFSFELPAGSSLLWATVDSNPVIPLQSSAGARSIVLDQERRSRVCLVWKAAAPASGASSAAWSLALPRAGAGRTTALVAVSTPPHVEIHAGPSGLEPATIAQLALARADALARSIRDFLTRIDRSSGRDHERLVSLIISHEMALRSAERSAGWGDADGAAARAEHPQNVSELIQSARDDCALSVRRAGFLADLASAQNYLGQAQGIASAALIPVAEPTGPERIRSLGRPFAWIGLLPGTSDPSAEVRLTCVARSWEEVWNRMQDKSGAALFVLPALVLVASAWTRRYWIRLLALAAALGLTGYAGGPLVLLGAMGVAAVGWKTTRDQGQPTASILADVRTGETHRGSGRFAS